MAARSPRVLLCDFRTADISGEIPFLFSKAGCDVEVYCAKNSWLRKNSYAKVWHAADTTSAATYVEGLVSLVRAHAYDWVVLTEDTSLRAAHEYLTDTELRRKILPLSSPANTRLLGSKMALSDLATHHGIRTPRFLAVSKIADIEESSIPFPVVLKVDKSSGGQGVFLCKTLHDAKLVYEALTEDKRLHLLLQEYISGENIAVEALFKNGALIASATSTVIGTMDGEFGVSCVRDYGSRKDIDEFVERIGTAFLLSGFCNITILRDSNDHLYLIEADSRPNIWFAAARHVGLDFSEAIRAYLSDSPVGVPLRNGNGRLRHFYRDVNRSLEQGDMYNLILWIINSDGRWKCIPWYDMRLFYFGIRLLITTRKDALVLKHPWLRTLKRLYTWG